jgi:hypothetical protein
METITEKMKNGRLEMEFKLDKNETFYLGEVKIKIEKDYNVMYHLIKVEYFIIRDNVISVFFDKFI